mmetsp:Transcript_12501/g.48028  ORF Transcript_12501/g.48028 Transcript_12501/m.48028 type:complete len:226 (+) Transcript_12501:381-1058(+)
MTRTWCSLATATAPSTSATTSPSACCSTTSGVTTSTAPASLMTDASTAGGRAWTPAPDSAAASFTPASCSALTRRSGTTRRFSPWTTGASRCLAGSAASAATTAATSGRWTREAAWRPGGQGRRPRTRPRAGGRSWASWGLRARASAGGTPLRPTGPPPSSSAATGCGTGSARRTASLTTGGCRTRASTGGTWTTYGPTPRTPSLACAATGPRWCPARAATTGAA